LYIEEGKVPLPHATVQLHAAIDRNLLATQEADAPAEERNELRRVCATEAETKVILVRAFEKEGAFLREEERKTREINLPCVDFRLCEVRVGREDRDKLRCDFPGHLAPDRSLPRPFTARERFPRFSDAVGDEFDPLALLQTADAADAPTPAQVVQEGIQGGRRPPARRATPVHPIDHRARSKPKDEQPLPHWGRHLLGRQLIPSSRVPCKRAKHIAASGEFSKSPVQHMQSDGEVSR